jgi:GrpB-like predicted nucleotidyltransferase (UPF0157 family)
VGTPQWIGPIAFRDYLRADWNVAVEYEALKRRLAQEHQFDREAYTQAKRPFIVRITDMALEMGYGAGIGAWQQGPRRQDREGR